MKEITKQSELTNAVQMANVILNKSYLPVLGSSQVVRRSGATMLSEEKFTELFISHIRFFEVEKVILNGSENMRDKLVSVFNAIWNIGGSFLLLIQGGKEAVSIKIGIKTVDGSRVGLAQNLLAKVVRGNFPGTSLRLVKRGELQTIHDFPTNSFVSAVTTIPGIRSKEENRERQYIQGLEKVIDSMQGHE